MGGRRGGSSRRILGSGGGGSAGGGVGGGRSISQKLDEGTGEAVATAAFAAIATANPAVAIMYAAYQVATYTYPIAKEGIKEYSKSRDKDVAVNKMKEETIRQTGRAVTDATVDAVAGAAVRGAMSSTKVSGDQTITTFVQTAVSDTISEAIS